MPGYPSTKKPISLTTTVAMAAVVAALGFALALFPDTGQAIDFDTDLRSSSTGAFRLGVNPGEWRSIDNVLHFYTSSSVSIGSGHTDPAATLEVDGYIRLNTTSSKPTCDATIRGTLWFVQSGSGVADSLEFCRWDTNAYAWSVFF